MKDYIENVKKNIVPISIGAALGFAAGIAAAPVFLEFPSASKILCEKENETSCAVRFACDIGWTNRGPC